MSSSTSRELESSGYSLGGRSSITSKINIRKFNIVGCTMTYVYKLMKQVEFVNTVRVDKVYLLDRKEVEKFADSYIRRY